MTKPHPLLNRLSLTFCTGLKTGIRVPEDAQSGDLNPRNVDALNRFL